MVDDWLDRGWFCTPLTILLKALLIRQEIIDKPLLKAGWDVTKSKKIFDPKLIEILTRAELQHIMPEINKFPYKKKTFGRFEGQLGVN